MSIIHEVITGNPKAVEDYSAGKNGALNFLVGQAMKKTRGCADPGELNRADGCSPQEQGAVT